MTIRQQLERLTQHCHRLGVHPDFRYAASANDLKAEGYEVNEDMPKVMGKVFWRKRK